MAPPAPAPATYATSQPVAATNYAAPPQQPPQSGTTVGSLTESYAGFLSKFRDPEPPPEAASTGVYPSVSISELFTSDSAPARTTSVPRPPVTYTASGQPYTPPAAQGPYGDAQPAVSARPAPDRSATGVYPSVSLSELFTSDSQPARTANVPRPPDTYTPSGQPYAPQPGAAPPPPNPEQSGTPYPQQTLFDVFSDRR